MTATSEPRRLKFALLGLGRLGAIRAKIIAFQQPRIQLVAVCDTKPGTDKWAAENLPANIRHFSDPEDCMKNSGAEAVLICTATAAHAPLIIRALDLDLHVMCEKPVSLDVHATAEVVQKAASKPWLKFLVPFTRRYDESYRAVKSMIAKGDLGVVHAVDSYASDVQDPNEFFVSFSEMSGGIFLDFGIHTVDAGRYLLDIQSDLKNQMKQVTRVVGMGQQAVYPKLAQYGDCDNGWGQIEFTNGKILTTHLGRTTTNGFEDFARVCGTKATSIIERKPSVQIRDQIGVRTQSFPDAFSLFDPTFSLDLAEFADGILDGKSFTCTPDDAFEAGKICAALQYSFRNNVPVYFDDDGMPIMEAKVTNGE